MIKTILAPKEEQEQSPPPTKNKIMSQSGREPGHNFDIKIEREERPKQNQQCENNNNNDSNTDNDSTKNNNNNNNNNNEDDIDSDDYYAVLGLKKQATQEEIKKVRFLNLNLGVVAMAFSRGAYKMDFWTIIN